MVIDLEAYRAGLADLKEVTSLLAIARGVETRKALEARQRKIIEKLTDLGVSPTSVAPKEK